MDASLHFCALAVRPKDETKSNRYWVAVLYPDVIDTPESRPSQLDFLWIKCREVTHFLSLRYLLNRDTKAI